MSAIKSFITKLLGQFNLKLCKLSNFKMLKEKAALHDADCFLHKLQSNDFKYFYKNISNKDMTASKAQLQQDLFVLNELNFKQNGFFVEFGATNGIDLSNTYLLEKEFNWKGILAEPAKIWHKDLEKNRTAFIEKNCVWHTSNKFLNFNETKVSELSTIDQFCKSDLHAKNRKNSKKYQIKTICLEDLLDKYHAPKVIDYLSIDTEGSEYEILSSFNFNKYKVKVITCEHNFTMNREKIFSLLSMKGYKRLYTDISRFDDWYVFKT